MWRARLDNCVFSALNHFNLTKRSFIPAILWFVVTVVLLCLPGSAIPKNSWFAVVHADKWVHIALFFTLCFLFARPLRGEDMATGKKETCLILILAGGIVYGTLMEFVQKYWIPNRSFEGADILADSAGCLAAYFFSRWRVLGKG